MEYLKVNCSDNHGALVDRGVLVDGRPNGRTNKVVIEIDAGPHTISLAPPPNFNPPWQDVTLAPGDTAPLSPKEVSFDVV